MINLPYGTVITYSGIPATRLMNLAEFICTILENEEQMVINTWSCIE